ncbi:MAG: hypothetical protein E7011_00520 [Alphaproteobacteria bacterium]|nr:hypothetical protein [Alphaproteobacteria bacterium]
MKQQVLKALANPSHIFYVPYSLAVLNFLIQFLIFSVVFVISVIATSGKNPLNPLFFLLSVIAVHSIIAIFSKRDPQLGQIVSAKIQLFKKKIPGKLAA